MGGVALGGACGLLGACSGEAELALLFCVGKDVMFCIFVFKKF